MERQLQKPRILTRVIKEKNFVAYTTPSASNLKVYVISTPYSREIINCPAEIHGTPFQKSLMRTNIEIINNIPEIEFLKEFELDKTEQTRVNIYNLLRGGQNARFRDALEKSKYHIEDPQETFLAICRHQNEEDEQFYAEQYDYMKSTFRRQSRVLTWDIVATGTSSSCALAKMAEDVSGLERFKLPDWIQKKLGPNNINERERRDLKSIIFGTIGADKLEEVLTPYDRFFKEQFPGYEGTTIVYMELIAGLASKYNQGNIFKIENGRNYYWPGTDLLLGVDATRTPEFESELYFEDGQRFISPCVVWDGGARGFSPHDFGKEMRIRWAIYKKLGKNKKASLFDVILERNPWLEEELKMNKDEFRRHKELIWKNIPVEEIDEIYRKQRDTINPTKIKELNTPRKLERIGNELIGEISGLG